MKKKTLVLICTFLVGLLILSYFLSQNVKPANKISLPFYSYDVDSNKLRESPNPDLRIKSFQFKDQKSEEVSELNIKDKIFVADYFFVSCPGICKVMGTQMQRIYNEFIHNEEFILISHTSKPEEDTPKVLMDYSERLGVTNQNKWLFLTGNKKQLYDVARNQYHIVDDKGNEDEEDFIHTERFVLVDKKGYIRGYYDGTDSVDVDKLIKDIHLLLK